MAVSPVEYRYFTKEMKQVFTEEHKLQKWLDVEVALDTLICDNNIYQLNCLEFSI